jgi:hypothetical protein
MNLEALGNILISTFFISLFSYIVFWLYRSYRIDRFRHEVFVLRDKLFDAAADGLISFDHPAYRLLRTLMNGHLRFAHKLTLRQPVILFLFDKMRGPIPSKGIAFEDDYEQAIRDLDADTVANLNKYKARLEILALQHVFFSVPEFFILILPIGLASLAYTLVKGIVQKTISVASTAVETRVTDAAYALGRQ